MFLLIKTLQTFSAGRIFILILAFIYSLDPRFQDSQIPRIPDSHSLRDLALNLSGNRFWVTGEPLSRPTVTLTEFLSEL